MDSDKFAGTKCGCCNFCLILIGVVAIVAAMVGVVGAVTGIVVVGLCTGDAGNDLLLYCCA